MQLPEKYLQPGEISLKLNEKYGLRISTDYIRYIRRESVTRGEMLFVFGEARAEDVYQWLKTNPQFRRRTASQRSALV